MPWIIWSRFSCRASVRSEKILVSQSSAAASLRHCSSPRMWPLYSASSSTLGIGTLKEFFAFSFWVNRGDAFADDFHELLDHLGVVHFLPHGAARRPGLIHHLRGLLLEVLEVVDVLLDLLLFLVLVRKHNSGLVLVWVTAVYFPFARLICNLRTRTLKWPG